MRELPVVLDIPTALHREVGRVMVGYAYLEYQLSQIIYAVLGINPKDGRLAIREPRAIDRLEVIFDLAESRYIEFTDDDKKLLREAVQACMSQRDQLAHGIWLRDPTTKILFLRVTKGSWQPVKGQRGKTKRLIKPEAMEYSADDCRALRLVIDETIATINQFAEDVLRILTSRKKSLPQSRSSNPHTDHIERYHQRRQRLSPA